MITPKIFSDVEKEQIRNIAIALERELAIELKTNKSLSEFSESDQFIEAIRRAKAKEIADSSPLFNLSPWLFWSPLDEWFARSDSKACRLVFKFSAAIKGFPYDKIDVEGVADD